MTKQQKENFIEDRISFWQKKLKLQNWKIDFKIVDKLKVPSDYGNILISWDAEEATIEIYGKCSEKVLENTIVHELVHLYTHRTLIFMEDILSKLCEPKIKTILKNELDLKENIAVERIARIFLELAKEKNERNQNRN